MPDITITITVTPLEQAMLDRWATKGGKTVAELAKAQLERTIKDRFEGEIQNALEELNQGQVTRKTQKLLKDFIDSKTQ